MGKKEGLIWGAIRGEEREKGKGKGGRGEAVKIGVVNV